MGSKETPRKLKDRLGFSDVDVRNILLASLSCVKVEQIAEEMNREPNEIREAKSFGITKSTIAKDPFLQLFIKRADRVGRVKNFLYSIATVNGEYVQDANLYSPERDFGFYDFVDLYPVKMVVDIGVEAVTAAGFGDIPEGELREQVHGRLVRYAARAMKDPKNYVIDSLVDVANVVADNAAYDILGESISDERVTGEARLLSSKQGLDSLPASTRAQVAQIAAKALRHGVLERDLDRLLG